MTNAEQPSGHSDALVGTLVGGRYRVTGVIGEGGMGVVYDAVHEELERPVALKVLSALLAQSEEALARFQREARTASNIGHPNIVDVYDLGRLEDGRPYLAMERLTGESFADVLEREARVAADRAAPLIRDAASALDAVHKKGLMHRDIKPENLMISTLGDGTETVKLLDFGLAAFHVPDPSQARLTRHGQVHGTPHYMAPEAGHHELPDYRADIYSLAVVAYEMLCGVVPFDSPNPLNILTTKMNQDPPSVTERCGLTFPDELEAVLAKGLARDPDQRYQSAGEFAHALTEVIARLTPHTIRHPVTAPPPAGEGRGSERPAAPQGRAGSSVSSEVETSTLPTVAALARRRRLAWLGAATAVGALAAAGFAFRDSVSGALGGSGAGAGGDNALATTSESPPTAGSNASSRGTAGSGTAAGDDEAADGGTHDATATSSKRDGSAETSADAGTKETGTKSGEAEPTARAATSGRDAKGDNGDVRDARERKEDIGDARQRAEARRAQRRPRTRDEADADRNRDTTSKSSEGDRSSKSSEQGDSKSSDEDAQDKARKPKRSGKRDTARAKKLASEGTTKLIQGKLSGAVQRFRKATRADAGHAPAWRGLGLAYERLGRTSQAIQAYERFLRLAPNSSTSASVRKRLEKLR